MIFPGSLISLAPGLEVILNCRIHVSRWVIRCRLPGAALAVPPLGRRFNFLFQDSRGPSKMAVDPGGPSWKTVVQGMRGKGLFCRPIIDRAIVPLPTAARIQLPVRRTI